MEECSLASAKNVLFLGAGASRPLGKMLMWEFIDHLSNVREIAGSALFHDIVGKKRDLEFLLEELQDIEEKEYLKYYLSDENRGALPPLPPPHPQRFETTFPELARSASYLRSLVEEQVFVSYRDFEDEAEVSRLLGPLFERLVDAGPGPLVVFTTNYDPAVERLCVLTHRYQCVDGFVHDPEKKEYFWDRGSFESSAAEFGRKPVFLFKLHGSVDWVRSGTRVVRGSPLFSGMDSRYPNVIIYPATKKVSFADPFFTHYTYLQDCLSRARYCLFVGYSFRDYDAITRIRAGVRKNPEISIQVLDPDAKSVVERLRALEINAKPLTGRLTAGSVLPELKPHLGA